MIPTRFRFGPIRRGTDTKGEKSPELLSSTSCEDFVIDTGREGLRRWVRGQNNRSVENENTNKPKRSGHDFCTSHVCVDATAANGPYVACSF